MKHGFSLIELICVLGLISLFASFVYPSYTQYLARAHRLDGQSALYDLASRLEQYHALNGTYQTATIGAGKETDVLSNTVSGGGWYRLNIFKATKQHYQISAEAIGQQFQFDKTCGLLTLDSHGHQGTLNKCWVDFAR